MHGYDICDHTRLNPEVGSQDEYEPSSPRFIASGLGQMLDFVPNHMGIDPETNPWWHDVLENGRSSAFAHFFDIDWEPVKPELQGKVLLPILGDQYGLVLERGDLRLGFERGALRLDYFEHHLPVNPRSAVRVLEHGLDDLRARSRRGRCRPARVPEHHDRAAEPAGDRGDRSGADRRAPPREGGGPRAAGAPGRTRAAHRCARRRRAVAAFNGRPGEPESFDLLHALLEEQAYRLAYWRTASHEINYRRFFDINTLAALRMEDEDVFEATHVLMPGTARQRRGDGAAHRPPGRPVRPGAVLRAPAGLWRARSAGRLAAPTPAGQPLYVLAEKILSAGEELPADVAGRRHDRLPVRQRRQRRASSTRPASARCASSTRGSRRQTAPVRRGRLREQEADRRVVARQRAERARPRAQPHLGGQPALARLHAREPARAARGGRRLLPRLPDLRQPAEGWTAADRERIETAVTRARWRNPTVETLDLRLLPRSRPAPRDETPVATETTGRRRRSGPARRLRAGRPPRLPRAPGLLDETPAVHRAGAGEGPRGHRLLPLQPARLAERGRRRTRRASAGRSPSSTRPTTRGQRAGRSR